MNPTKIHNISRQIKYMMRNKEYPSNMDLFYPLTLGILDLKHVGKREEIRYPLIMIFSYGMLIYTKFLDYQCHSRFLKPVSGSFTFWHLLLNLEKTLHKFSFYAAYVDPKDYNHKTGLPSLFRRMLPLVITMWTQFVKEDIDKLAEDSMIFLRKYVFNKVEIIEPLRRKYLTKGDIRNYMDPGLLPLAKVLFNLNASQIKISDI